MHSIKKILVTLMCIMLLSTSLAFAEDVIVKEYDFQTKNPEYSSYTIENIGEGDMKDVPLTVENGFFTVKRVTDVKINLLSEDAPEDITEEVLYEYLDKKELPEGTNEMVLDDGTILQLLDTKWEAKERTPITGTSTKKGHENKPDFPKTKEVSAELEDGTVITAVAELVEVKATGQSYAKEFSVTGKFIGEPDVSYYVLDGTRIPNNPETPKFKRYEDTILKVFGMNPSKYKITSGEWTSDYIEEDGNIVRYATFKGYRLTNDWTAYYKEKMTDESPNVATYTATCTYGKKIEPTYNVHVTVEYGKTEIIIGRVVGTSVGLAVIAGLAAFIIVFLTRKKKQEESDNLYYN